LPLTTRRAYLEAMPARKHTPPKLLGRHGDLVALGLSRQQIDDAVKSGALRILKRSPKQGQRYFSMVDAYRLMGYSGVPGLVPESELNGRLDTAVTTAIRRILPGLARQLVHQEVTQAMEALSPVWGKRVREVLPQGQSIQMPICSGGGSY